MNHARTRRLAAGAIVTTMLAALLTLLSWSPSQAAATSSNLEVSPEVRSTSVGGSVTLTAQLVDPNTGLPAATTTPVIIDFEFEGGPADLDGNTPATPDTSCIVTSTHSTCTATVTGAT